MFQLLIIDFEKKNDAHNWTNTHFVKKLSKSKNVLINLNKNLDKNLSSYGKVIKVNNNLPFNNLFILKYFRVLVDIFLIYSSIRKIKFKKVFILSFNNILIPFILYLFSNTNKIYLFCHNNIDKKRNSKIHNFLFSRLKKKNVILVVYEKYILEYLKSEKFNSIILKHPIAKIKKIKILNKKKIILHHGIDGNSKIVFTLDKLLKKNFYLSIARGKRYSSDSLKIRNYFRYSYDTLVYNAEFIIIHLNYDYRVSNLLYKILSNEKKTKIIMSDCIFSRQMKKKYPHLKIHIFKDEDDLKCFFKKLNH